MKKQKYIINSLLIAGLLFPFTLNAQSIQDALNAMYGERYSSAKTSIKNIIKSDPEDDQSYYYAGYIYSYLNQDDSAKMYFDQGLKLDDKSAINFAGKGWMALKNDDTVSAKSFFEKAIAESKSRNRTRVYNAIANGLLHSEHTNPKKALDLLKIAKEEAYNDKYEKVVKANTTILIGDAYLALHQAGDAIGNYKDAMLFNPNLTARMHVKIGEIYIAARNSQAALAEFEKAKKADTTFAPVYSHLGDLYFDYKHSAKNAKEMFNKYLQLSEAKNEVKEKFVKVLYVGKEYDKAITQINQVLAQQPDDIVMNRLLSYSLFRTKKYTEASAAFKKYFSVVTKKNILTQDYLLYAQCLFKQDQTDKGIATAFKAIALDSTAINAVQELASKQMDEGNFEVAAQLYSKVLDTKANLSSQDYYSAGRAFIKTKDYTKADSSFTHLIELSPDNYIGYYMMAISKYMQDPKGEKGFLAKPYYDSVVKLTESKPEKYKSVLINSYQYIAQYYTQKKKIDEAYTYWKKIDALDPGNKNAQSYFEYYQKVLDFRRKKAAAEKAAAAQ